MTACDSVNIEPVINILWYGFSHRNRMRETERDYNILLERETSFINTHTHGIMPTHTSTITHSVQKYFRYKRWCLKMFLWGTRTVHWRLEKKMFCFPALVFLPENREIIGRKRTRIAAPAIWWHKTEYFWFVSRPTSLRYARSGCNIRCVSVDCKRRKRTK